ncbi:MAG TPA: hypothetical protein VFI31_13770, partial [Pirellulales bacterium]|nr:hypothetical protein [Pirellulales bacterium]
MNRFSKLRFAICHLQFAIFAVFAPLALAAPPSWMALPEETVAMVRVPDARAFLEALRTQTKLGAVLMTPARVDGLVKALSEQWPKEWKEIQEALHRADLTGDDCHALVQGELGAALAFQPRGDKPPLMLAFGWIEPGEELAPRFVAALGAWLAEKSDQPHGPQRKDIELAGHEVLHI